ncbi:hypothetical protein HAX54_021001 [Datura stramonium]|uniref:Uncharacterized protein n=1 Tax=Datura stramonium TaxID=4076 RepID=A0ABS8S2Z0_DATST|nr:hypothetical protein [Datura stramonium]
MKLLSCPIEAAAGLDQILVRQQKEKQEMIEEAIEDANASLMVFGILDGLIMFDDFDQLTSAHVNLPMTYFLVSGYSKHVALYDISSSRQLQKPNQPCYTALSSREGMMGLLSLMTNISLFPLNELQDSLTRIIRNEQVTRCCEVLKEHFPKVSEHK